MSTQVTDGPEVDAESASGPSTEHERARRPAAGDEKAGDGASEVESAEGRTAAPSISAAEALAQTPLCASLSSVELARLVPELEERQLQPGEAAYRQGDEADGLYLIRSGRVEVTMATEAGAQPMSTLQAPSFFGEVELLTGERRVADVVAQTPLVLWQLPKERFDGLLRERPQLPLEIAAELAGRLADATRALSQSREQVTGAAQAAYWSLPHGAQALLRRAALFVELDGQLLRELLGSNWSDAAFERARDEAVFLGPAEREGWLRWLQPSVRQFLLHHLRAEVGERGLAQWRRRASDCLRARDDASAVDTLELLCLAKDWRRLADALEEQGPALREHDPGGIEGYLRALPGKEVWSRPGLVALLAECCAADGKLEQAVDTYLEAERRNPAARDGEVARASHGALAELYARLGHEDRRLASLLRVEQLTTPDGRAGQRGRSRGTAQILTEVPSEAAAAWRKPNGVVRFAGLCRSVLGGLVDRCSERGLSWRAVLTVAAILLTGAVWFLPPLPGLSAEGTRVLATMGALIVLSFLDVLPEYLLGLLLIGAWVVTGTLPVGVATSGFASTTWFLMLAAMAIGAAVERSGLLYRGALELVRRLPASHLVRCATLGSLGAVFSLGMPSLAGRIMLALPLVQDISDALRYPHRSGGSAGLALSGYVGFGMLGPLFLTGMPGCLILWGLLPPESQARMSWGMWFLAALPTHALLLGLSLAFILCWYRPEREDAPSEATIALQRRVLGPLSRSEWSVIGVLALLLVGFATQSLHGIDPAWIAIAALVLLFATRALDDEGFKTGVNISFMVYVGVIIGFGSILAHVELDTWIGGMLAGLTGLARGSQALFVGAVALVGIGLALLLRPGPIGVLLALALFGPAQSMGVDPWVVALAVLLSTNIWVYPQQNMLYLTAFYATGERAFSHEQARPLALVYPLFTVIALVASVPYWRWLGLLQ